MDENPCKNLSCGGACPCEAYRQARAAYRLAFQLMGEQQRRVFKNVWQHEFESSDRCPLEGE